MIPLNFRHGQSEYNYELSVLQYQNQRLPAITIQLRSDKYVLS